MCREMMDRKETHSYLLGTEFKADDLVDRLAQLEEAEYYEFTPTESYRNKVSMLSARAKALAEEIMHLDPEKENV